ncbi:MAG: 2-oxoacid:acceptor oxidoreductase family protein [Candidatus Neomarinimicrobiota bacterium]|nr:2-oxoacid:acceptor oxidoreductase family protein [Candidatus Neomarinimicrobiota bacterium]MEE1505863.1 2-oxoacid:acceptor oxidoreductase family protein [Candidatus Neomarinimicrobiota bacterium]MEE1573116.1 2-oxoacid:acceptor oxidoreductase family protein [Candidatus Neomarinimicrobiota bacterium]HJN68446.1 2-oxoacid:acceptor oxidoreductase family protein [Candidatus Neomarinimicrobiota bacterium]
MVVWVETHVTQGACAYPITSSTTMGSGYQSVVANGGTNIWGEKLAFVELESEHSSATTCEGFALAGGRVTNFTSGQGLVLMKEVLYTISGKRLPVVFHIGARALTSHSLNVHAGHDDVMAVTDCGWGMLFARNAQEAGDMALIARRTSENSQTPFLNIMDGFLTTHTIQNVTLPEPELMNKFVQNPNEKLVNFMDPYHPIMSGVVQNQDSYMKGKIAQRSYTDKIEENLLNSMDEYHKLTGRRYGLIDAYKTEDAEYVLVGMGTMTETAQACINYIRNEKKIKAGVLNITSFRPFPGRQIVSTLNGIKAFTVLERMDNPLAESNPLTMEIKAAFADFSSHSDDERIRIPKIYSGSAGLGSRDIRPTDIIAVFENMVDDGKRYFAIGIDHELGLKTGKHVDVRPKGSFSMRGHSVGGYGSVTTNKVMATIVADLFDMYVQAYPKYGSEKKGLPTTYYLTISPEPVRTHNELEFVEFVPLNDVNAFNLANPLNGLRENSLLFVQTHKTDIEDIWSDFPTWAQKKIREDKIRVLALDTVKIAREVSSRSDLLQRMQGIVLLGIFLKSTPFLEQSGISEKELMRGVEKSLRKYFGKRGEQVVQDNLSAVKRGFTEVFEIKRSLIENKTKEKIVS